MFLGVPVAARGSAPRNSVTHATRCSSRSGVGIRGAGAVGTAAPGACNCATGCKYVSAHAWCPAVPAYPWMALMLELCNAGAYSAARDHQLWVLVKHRTRDRQLTAAGADEPAAALLSNAQPAAGGVPGDTALNAAPALAAEHFSQLGSPTEGASWRREGGRKLNALSSRQTIGRYSQVLLLADLHGDLAQAAAALQVLGVTGQVSCG